MSEKQDTGHIRISQVLAAALAAVTAALLGSTMGVAGTVVGAGVASVVSTVGGALYLRSIQRTKQGVRTVRAKVVGRGTGSTVLMTEPAAPEDDRDESADTAESDDTAESGGRRLNWPVLVAGSVLAFLLGMLAITGFEWLRGEPLSGGEGTTFGNIVRPHQGASQHRDDTEPDNGPATPPSSTNPTVTVTQPPSSTTTPPGSSEPPSDSSKPPTTTPPTTTTGGEPSDEPTAPGGTVPPTG